MSMRLTFSQQSFLIRQQNELHILIKRKLHSIKNALNIMTDPDPYEVVYDKDGFREYDLFQKSWRLRRYKYALKKQSFKKEEKVFHPRYKTMSIDQDWTNVWPTAKTFNWSIVPFEVRQGYLGGKKTAVPPKKSNVELLKIPNFLHLTPPHIKKHCAALKQHLSEWPKELKTDEDCKKYFPLEVTTHDYVFSGLSIRDPRARICSMKFDLDTLELDEHARDKFLRLVGDRYNSKTNEVTIVTDSCPLKQQNYDYGLYLLTATYFESWTFEEWENEKEQLDWEKYLWDLSPSRKSAVQLVKRIEQNKQASSTMTTKDDAAVEPVKEISEEEVIQKPEIQLYKQSVTELHDHGENLQTLDNYKNAVLGLLNVTPPSKMKSVHPAS